MVRKILRRWLPGALVALSAAGLHAAQFLVVSRAGGGWAFEEADSIQINGKDKVRAAALSASSPAAWDPRSIGRLPETPLEGFQAIVRNPDGSLLARSGEAADWQLLIPNNAKAKGPQSAAELWRDAALLYTKDRKESG